MRLLKGFEAVDLALLTQDCLIIADIHIGFEEALNKQGVLMPRQHFPDLMKRMEAILEKVKDRKLKHIIIAGDLKHEFGTISDQEWRHVLKFLDFLSRHCERVILIRGNHDTILGPIAEKRDIEVHDHFTLDGGKILITHGDKLPDETLLKEAKTIIIGHEHPSVALRQGARVERYKAFFLGSYKRKRLIVLPSLNLMTEGANLMGENTLSPFLKQDIEGFKVFIVEDEIYPFGTLGDIKRL